MAAVTLTANSDDKIFKLHCKDTVRFLDTIYHPQGINQAAQQNKIENQCFQDVLALFAPNLFFFSTLHHPLPSAPLQRSTWFRSVGYDR